MNDYAFGNTRVFGVIAIQLTETVPEKHVRVEIKYK